MTRKSRIIYHPTDFQMSVRHHREFVVFKQEKKESRRVNVQQNPKLKHPKVSNKNLAPLQNMA